jgi:hypothetical protein
MGAALDMTAMPAEKHGIEPATIQKQDRLLAPVKCFVDGLN